MKTAGIIAEYNPFHLGHQYQINYVKEISGADYVIIAMSGDFVQRGAPALLSKHRRAEMALRCGADLVLELPVSVSCSSAEFFAMGGVSLLHGLGIVNMLCFGSEEGELPLFLETAELLLSEPAEYQTALQAALREGNSFPLARNQALLSCFCQSHPELSGSSLTAFLSSPNNILGIEYCKALLRLNSLIRPVTLKRKGTDYHEIHLTRALPPSASGIRNYLEQVCEPVAEEIHDALSDFLPQAALELLTESCISRSCMTEKDLDLLLHYCLLSETAESLARYLDVTPDLARRILNRRNGYEGFRQFVQLLKTRELTQTRIQRALLHILLRIRTVPGQVPYARVLGFRNSASPLLKAIKKEGKIPLLTKPSDAQKILDAQALSLLEETTYASNIYESLLCHKTGRKFVHEYEKPILLL